MSGAGPGPRRPPAVAVLASVVAVGLLAVAACSGSSGKRLIPPPPGTVAVITTAPPGSDLTGVALSPVEGRVPTEDVEIMGGDSVLSGLIAGPDGPVAGATVRLERFVGDAMATLQVVSNADGTWRAPQLTAPTTIPPVTTTASTVFGDLPTIPPPTTTTAPPPPSVTSAGSPKGLLGGRYRVRAWRTPDLALTAPQILFVEAKQEKQISLQLARYTGTTVSAITSPDPPVVDAAVSVTAVVTSANVDGNGVVRAVPLPNATVSLAVGSGFSLTGGPTLTNGQGRATFQLRCLALGQSPVELTVNGTQSFTLPVRACVAPPSTTTSSPFLDPFGNPSTTSSIPGGATSSTTGGGPPTT